MKNNLYVSDCWIMSQLNGIRMLERELDQAFKRPGEPYVDVLRRLNQLNTWLNLVDRALSLRAKSRRPRAHRTRTRQMVA